jgi:tetratricopeptide (TPR) repeat protein
VNFFSFAAQNSIQMKKLLFILALAASTPFFAQGSGDLKTHFEKYYQEMKKQGDVNGVINALTHLNVVDPSQARRDTLAYVYMNGNQHLQALNTIGVEKNDSDSNLAIQVKAVSLKALNQPQRAIEQFQALYDRLPDPFVAYEMADLKIQVGDIAGAEKDIQYGIANSTLNMKHAFYERQQPYEVPLKAAFYHLQGLLIFNKDKSKVDEAIGFMDKALELDSNFNLASLSKQALEKRKTEGDGGN